MSDWWFGTLLLFFHILGRIIPTDFHIFQRGSNHQPDVINNYHDWEWVIPPIYDEIWHDL